MLTTLIFIIIHCAYMQTYHTLPYEYVHVMCFKKQNKLTVGHGDDFVSSLAVNLSGYLLRFHNNCLPAEKAISEKASLCFWGERTKDTEGHSGCGEEEARRSKRPWF